MVGLTSVLLSGLSGLRASQTAMGVISQNIANANTPSYVRTEVTLQARSQLGAGAGVEVSNIRRAADQFLATASYIAESARGASAARSNLLERAQASFGNPASDATMFAALDDFWSAMTEIGVDPASTLRRGDAISALQNVFSEIQRVGQTLQDLIAEADGRIADAVDQAQDLMNRIASFNEEIQLNKRTGTDASGAENAQAALIDQLSTLMDIRVTQQEGGGVHVRTNGGALLVGVRAANISYSANAAPYVNHPSISFNEELGTNANLEAFLTGGEIKGLLQARDVDLPGLAEGLAGFAAKLGDSLNAVHNENSSSPAVSNLVGRQTGLIGADAIGTTGNAFLAVTDANGNLTQRLLIDFDTMTITGEAPVANYSFAGGTIADFANALNSALNATTPAGAASFSGGVLRMNVGAGGGLIMQQDPAQPSSRGGRSFSLAFGLNDLVSRATPLFFASGVDGPDAHGFTAGGQISYRVSDAQGRFLANRTISITGPLASGSWNDLVTALNAPGTGLGGYGTFTLDAGTGRIAFSPAAGYQVDLMGDSTQRGDTGVSFTSLHGLSKQAVTGRATELNVNALIAANPSRLAVGKPDITVALGARVVEAGDGRGATALAAARDTVRNFGAAGVMTSQSTTLAAYAARLGGEAGRMASDAERSAQGAQAIAIAANDRRAQIEGVTIDDELMKMTVYQNSYAAAARVIQAATEMLDVLLSIGYR